VEARPYHAQDVDYSTDQKEENEKSGDNSKTLNSELTSMHSHIKVSIPAITSG
jgi:hypothetical protein